MQKKKMMMQVKKSTVRGEEGRRGELTCFRAGRLYRNAGGGQRELWVLKDTDGGSRRAPRSIRRRHRPAAHGGSDEDPR